MVNYSQVSFHLLELTLGHRTNKLLLSGDCLCMEQYVIEKLKLLLEEWRDSITARMIALQVAGWRLNPGTTQGLQRPAMRDPSAQSQE